MNTRPRSRAGVPVSRRNINTPIRISVGASAATLNDNSWTTSVVPTLAPSMTARAGTSSTMPEAVKPVVINPVAVLLWSSAVTPMPAMKGPETMPQARRRESS